MPAQARFQAPRRASQEKHPQRAGSGGESALLYILVVTKICCMDAMQILAEPRRQRILRAVWRTELSAGQIHRQAGRVTFGAVSQHLALLTQHGFVACRRAGRQRFYRAVPEGLGALRAYFEQLWGDKLSELKQLAEQAAKEPT